MNNPNDQLNLDLTNFKSKRSARVPEGDYTVRVEDLEMTTSQSGNQMVNIWLKIAEGPFRNQVLMDRLVLTDSALWRVVAFLQAVQIDTPSQKISIPLRLIQGRTLTVSVADDEFNGRVKSEVKDYQPVLNTDSSTPTENDHSDAAAAMAEEMKTTDPWATVSSAASVDATDDVGHRDAPDQQTAEVSVGGSNGVVDNGVRVAVDRL